MRRELQGVPSTVRRQKGMGRGALVEDVASLCDAGRKSEWNSWIVGCPQESALDRLLRGYLLRVLGCLSQRLGASSTMAVLQGRDLNTSSLIRGPFLTRKR